MSKRLANYVYVNGTAYGPDDKLPADVAKQITNPNAWADGAAPEGDDDEPEGYDSLKKADLEADDNA